MNLELYFFESCPFCQRVLRKIKELSLADKITLKDINKNREDESFHVKTTGRRTVPCLYVDGVPMFESIDINKWLETNAERIKSGS